MEGTVQRQATVVEAEVRRHVLPKLMQRETRFDAPHTGALV
jgi:hypothetical protein